MLRLLPHMRAFSFAGGEPLGQLEQALLHMLQELLRALTNPVPGLVDGLFQSKSWRGWNGRATV